MSGLPFPTSPLRRTWPVLLAALAVTACSGVGEADDEALTEGAISGAETFRREAVLDTEEGRADLVQLFERRCEQTNVTTTEEKSSSPYEIVVHRCEPRHPPKAVVLVVPGTMEPSISYAETIADLLDRDYRVIVTNNRGDGANPRLLADDPSTPINESHRRHANSYWTWMVDLERVIDEVVLPKRDGLPMFLVGHSLGGAIATLYLEEHPDNPFDAALLSAPMYLVKTAWWAAPVARAGDLVMDERWIPGAGDFDSMPPFDGNKVTTSRARYDFVKTLFFAQPELQQGGPTYGWVRQAFDLSRRVRANAARIKTPFEIYSAGRDQLVDPEAHKSVCASANGKRSSETCRLVDFPTAEHALLLEGDAIRDDVLGAMTKFMAKSSDSQR